MKNIWLKVISSLALGASVILPQATMAAELTSNQDVTPTAINLAFHGYQGYFINQGIPSGSAFITAVHLGQIDAEKLVKSAIAKGRLAPDTLNNQSYLDAVQASLQLIERRK